jgi:hypothetical protein
LFRQKQEADIALIKVRSNGFKDAFVVPVIDNQKISFDRAASLEKDWGNISLGDEEMFISELEIENQNPPEPPTLVYRIEVRKVDTELDEDEVINIRKLTGQKEFDVFQDDEQKYVYLIGKFLTFESAVSFSDLLYRNGLLEAKVVAYLGKKEIPLETARELFDMYFKK